MHILIQGAVTYCVWKERNRHDQSQIKQHQQLVHFVDTHKKAKGKNVGFLCIYILIVGA